MSIYTSSMIQNPRFLTPLIFEDDLGLPYTLWRHLTYVSWVAARVITVPKGFQTDLASIPQILQNILPRSGRYDKAAVVHDYLYRYPRGLTRKAADDTLFEAMCVCGVGPLPRWNMYLGVRLGGWLPWRRYRAL